MTTGKLRVLVTGFFPFAGYSSNPSGDAALALARMHRVEAFDPRGHPIVGVISAKVVDVVWSNDPTQPDMKGAADQIEAEIVRLSPHVVISLGMADKSFRIERVAKDVDGPIPDNRGFAPPRGRREFSREPLRRTTSLPRTKIENAWSRMGITNVESSDDAGSFLCEDVFYRVMRIAQGALPDIRVLRAGFVHVPKTGEVAQSVVDSAIAAAVTVTLGDIRQAEYN